MKAWLYARVSTRKRSQDASPERQLEQLREFARLREWQAVGEGADRISGKAFRNRPEWERMMSAVRSRRVDRVLVVDLDRVGRASLRSMLEEVETIHNYGAALVVLRLGGEPVDLGSAMGRLAFVMLSAIGDFFRLHTIEKIHDGLESAKRRGVRLGRPPAVPPDVVNQAAELKQGGLSWGAVARRLVELERGVYAPQTLRTAVLGATKKAPENEVRTPQSEPS